MSDRVEKFIAEIDQLIRSAQGDSARAKLQALSIKEIDPSEHWKIAALARRVNLPELSIQILRPIVRPVKKISHEPTNEDLAEYAGALLRLGASQEAYKLLQKVNVQRVPEALLFQAILKMKDWEYEAAAGLLKEFLAKDIPAYSDLVGRMNLAACYLLEGPFDEAKEILLKLVSETEGQKESSLIHANCIRLLGNLELNRNHLQAALGYFYQGESLLGSVGGLESFFSRKWLAITEFLIRRSHQDGLLSLEREAIEKQHWETLRDIDFHRAFVSQDPGLVQKLYIGTPMVPFRERLQRKFPKVEIPEAFELKLGDLHATKRTVINTRDVESFKVPLKGGQSIHRLFNTLLSDFYRPFSVPALFECLFPDEYYAPKVSEYRVHQAIKRLRAWFKANKLPLIIEADQNFYRLNAIAPCTLLLGAAVSTSVNADSHRLSVLKDRLEIEFSVAEVALLLGVSRRSATDLIRKAVDAGHLEKIGNGPKTRYRFAKDLRTSSAA